MLRVCHSYLSNSRGLIYFRGQLFYGLTYRFDQEGLLEKIEHIINGEVIGLCHERINPDDRGTPRVHFATLIDSKDFYEGYETGDYEDPQYVFHGELFQGYAYIFNRSHYIDQSLNNFLTCIPIFFWY